MGVVCFSSGTSYFREKSMNLPPDLCLCFWNFASDSHLVPETSFSSNFFPLFVCLVQCICFRSSPISSLSFHKLFFVYFCFQIQFSFWSVLYQKNHWLIGIESVERKTTQQPRRLMNQRTNEQRNECNGKRESKRRRNTDGFQVYHTHKENQHIDPKETNTCTP